MEDYLQFVRVVYVQGARQCGKTTLVKSVSDRDVLYRIMDSITDLSAAQEDPVLFVRHQAKRMIEVKAGETVRKDDFKHLMISLNMKENSFVQIFWEDSGYFFLAKRFWL